MFNESVFAIALLYYLNTNGMTDRSKEKSVIKTLIIVWTLGNVVNICKKWAIFGLHKLWRFYGHVFELFITLQLLVIIYLIFLCDQNNKSQTKTDDSSGYVINDWVNKSAQELDTSVCYELTFVIIRILVKLIQIRLVILASLRAYKGLEDQPILRLFLLSFSMISLFYPLFSEAVTTHYNLR